MKCLLPSGCHNPNRCGDDGECYWTAVHQVHEARREAAQREHIADADVLAFGCDLEAGGFGRCERWCHLPSCPFVLKERHSAV